MEAGGSMWKKITTLLLTSIMAIMPCMTAFATSNETTVSIEVENGAPGTVVEFTVTDDNNPAEPIKDASLEIYSATDGDYVFTGFMTGEDGKVSYKCTRPNTTYQFRFTKAGYADTTKEVAITDVPAETKQESVVMNRNTNAVTITAKENGTNTLLNGVSIQAYVGETAVGSPIITDENGTASFNLKTGTYKFTASLNGYETLNSTEYLINQDKSIELLLKLDTTSKYSVILNAKDNNDNLLDGVTFTVKDSSGNVVGTAVTGEALSGSCSIPNLSNGSYTYEAVKPGYHTVQGVFTIAGDNVTETAALTPIPESSFQLTLKFFDADGTTPLSDVSVQMKDANGNVVGAGVVKSDANGEFVVEHLVPGSYTYTAAKDGYVTISDREVVLGAADKTEKIVMVLQAATVHQVTFGGFTDSSTGNAIEGVKVTIYDANNNVVAVGTTGADGTCVIGDLPDGTYTYTAQKVGYDTLTGSAPIVVNGSGVTVPAESMTPVTANTVELKVTNSDGAAVSNAKIWLYDSEGNLVAGPITTNADGDCQVSVPDGEYAYKVEASEHASANGKITISGGVSTPITPLNKLYEITFTVKSSELLAEKLEGAVVKVMADGSLAAEGQTDSNGQVTLKLSNGSYTWIVTKEGYQNVTSSSALVISGSSETVNVSMEKVPEPPKEYDITFQVKDSVSGAAINKANVNVYKNGTSVGNKETNASGVSVFQLEAGDYTYTVSADGYDAQNNVALTVSNSAATVPVALVKTVTPPPTTPPITPTAPPTTPPVTPTVPPTTPPVTPTVPPTTPPVPPTTPPVPSTYPANFNVKDYNENGLSDAYVTVFDSNGSEIGTQRTVNGGCSFQLKPGNYTYKVDKTDYVGVSSQQLNVSGPVNITVTLAKKSTDNSNNQSNSTTSTPTPTPVPTPTPTATPKATPKSSPKASPSASETPGASATPGSSADPEKDGKPLDESTAESLEEAISKPVPESKDVSSDAPMDIGVRVVYSNGQPVAGKLVELHSDISRGTTDSDGWILFKNVIPGAHTIYVKDNKGNVLGSTDFQLMRSDGTSMQVKNGTSVVRVDAAVSTVALEVEYNENGLGITGVQAGGVPSTTPLATTSAPGFELFGIKIYYWWIFLVILLLVLILLFVWYKRRNKEDEEDDTDDDGPDDPYQGPPNPTERFPDTGDHLRIPKKRVVTFEEKRM